MSQHVLKYHIMTPNVRLHYYVTPEDKIINVQFGRDLKPCHVVVIFADVGRDCALSSARFPAKMQASIRKCNEGNFADSTLLRRDEWAICAGSWIHCEMPICRLGDWQRISSWDHFITRVTNCCISPDREISPSKFIWISFMNDTSSYVLHSSFTWHRIYTLPNYEDWLYIIVTT